MPEDKMKLLNDCKMQEKATDEDVQMFLGQKRPESRTGKCFMACIYERTPPGGVSQFYSIISSSTKLKLNYFNERIVLFFHRLRMARLMVML